VARDRDDYVRNLVRSNRLERAAAVDEVRISRARERRDRGDVNARIAGM